MSAPRDRLLAAIAAGPQGRVIVGIAGPPGSGTSTLAEAAAGGGIATAKDGSADWPRDKALPHRADPLPAG